MIDRDQCVFSAIAVMRNTSRFKQLKVLAHMRSSWRFRREHSNVVAMVAINVTNLLRKVQPSAASVDQRCPGRHGLGRIKMIALSVPGNLSE